RILLRFFGPGLDSRLVVHLVRIDRRQVVDAGRRKSGRDGLQDDILVRRLAETHLADRQHHVREELPDENHDGAEQRRDSDTHASLSPRVVGGRYARPGSAATVAGTTHARSSKAAANAHAAENANAANGETADQIQPNTSDAGSSRMP